MAVVVVVEGKPSEVLAHQVLAAEVVCMEALVELGQFTLTVAQEATKVPEEAVARVGLVPPQ